MSHRLRTESLEQVLPGINDQRNLAVQIHRIKQKSIESDPNPSPTNTSQIDHFWNRELIIMCALALELHIPKTHCTRSQGG